MLFEAAGLPMNAFTPARPTIVPPVHADQRVAWEGHLPEVPDHAVRVEAAGFAGKPVFFVIAGPWTASSREAARCDAAASRPITSSLEALVMPALMLAGAVLARRNVKLGRGDRRGAFRAAAFVFFTILAAWLFRRHVMPLGSRHRADVRRHGLRRCSTRPCCG